MLLEDEKKMQERCESDADYAAHARELMPELLNRLDKLRDEHKRLLDACAAVDWSQIIRESGKAANRTTENAAGLYEIRDLVQELRPEGE